MKITFLILFSFYYCRLSIPFLTRLPIAYCRLPIAFMVFVSIIIPVSKQDTIEITINGESHSITPGISLVDLLGNLELPEQRVAIELNRSIASRNSWKNTLLKSGDVLEIVHFVGGG